MWKLFFQCDRLEETGCDSLVIVASGFNHIKMGSKKGINYLADFTSFIEGFSHYCQGNSFFSSPVRKYRKSYCSHPSVGVSVGVAQNVKVFG